MCSSLLRLLCFRRLAIHWTHKVEEDHDMWLLLCNAVPIPNICSARQSNANSSINTCKAAAANTYISIFISTAHKERTGWRRGLPNPSGFVLRNLQGFPRLVYSSPLLICPPHQVSWILMWENTSVTLIFAHCTTRSIEWHQTWVSVTAYFSGKCPPQMWTRVLLSWKIEGEKNEDSRHVLKVRNVEGQTAVLAPLWCWRVLVLPVPRLCSLYPQTPFLQMIKDL